MEATTLIALLLLFVILRVEWKLLQLTNQIEDLKDELAERDSYVFTEKQWSEISKRHNILLDRLDRLTDRP